MDAIATAHAIQARNKEINHLLGQPIVDHLAIEELMAANQRDARALRLQTAQNIVGAAQHTPLRPELALFMDRHFPRPTAINQSLKGAI